MFQKEFNFKTCFDVDGPRSKELKKMGKNGDRFIPPFWKMMTLYVKGDSFEIPGNKEIAAKMDTCSSISLTWFRNF